MEAAEVDEGVGAKEEVGDDGGDGVELSCGCNGEMGQYGGAFPSHSREEMVPFHLAQGGA